MKGFFSSQQTTSASRPDGKQHSCASCGLYKDCSSPKMKPYGNFKKRILNIGEAPTRTDDSTGKPFQGKTGQLLQKAYMKLGIDLFEDCLNIHSVLCRASDQKNNDRIPTNQEIDDCRKNILQIIAEYKPHVIVLLGGSALYSLIGHRWKKNFGTITKWRGFAIPDQDYKAWVCPTFAPLFIERSKDDGVEEVIWMQDLKNAVEHVDQILPVYNKPVIDVITDLSVFDKITSGWIAFDFETTGLKPHATGHRIICCAVADTDSHAFVFMMPQTRQERLPFVNLLTRKEVGKVVQNFNFESSWSEVRLNTIVENWIWDTMLASHILDNRTGVTGLKLQVYLNFGVVDYSSSIQPFLEAVNNDNANSINRIQELISTQKGQSDLLYYCALDALYERRLAEIQMDLIEGLPF
jgi:uracil-DNA glycosylase